MMNHQLRRGLAGIGAALLLGVPAVADVRNKVLIIGIDGLRPDALLEARTPCFDRLIAKGALSVTAQTGDITISGPGWSSLLTGVWRDKHGVDDNAFGGRAYDAYPCFFARVKEVRPELVTASFVSWVPIDTYIIESSGADIRFVHDYEDDGDARCVEAAVRALRDADPDVTFVYFADPDVAGHNHGFHPSVADYRAEIEEVDGQVARLLAAVHDRGTYDDENWLILVSTDHGGTLDGGHAGGQPDQRTIFYLASGSAAGRGRLHGTVNQVDLPVTAMAHLGVRADPAWQLDGRVRGLQSATPLRTNLIDNGGAEHSTGAETLEVNRGIAGWSDLGNMTAIAYGAPEGFPDDESPGPAQRGNTFFAGGASGDSAMTQVIDIADLRELIDTGSVSFRLSGFLGGFAGQRDMATLHLEFLDDGGGERGRSRIGPVTVQDRIEAFGGSGSDLTGLLHREAHGHVPTGTRRLNLRLVAEVGTGGCDGYADELSLILYVAEPATDRP